MAEIVCVTCAYNAESTLERAVKSVLKQTFADFEYYIIDNGSTDTTRLIIQRYERTDKRVKGIYIDTNPGYSIYNNWLCETLKASSLNGNWLSFLDADDEYFSSFFAQMFRFANENTYDIVCCGNEFYDAGARRIQGKRLLPANLCIDTSSAFDANLPVYYQFIRTQWGKLFSFDVLRKCDFSRVLGAVNSDTSLCIEAFRNSNRIGILSESLHRYYIYPTSSSYKIWGNRNLYDQLLLDRARDFLIAKTGCITSRNGEFLLLVYMNAIKDTLNVLLNAEIPEHEKIACVIDIFSHKHTKQLATPENLGALIGDAPGQTKQRRELFTAVAQWLLTREEVPDEQIEQFCAVGEFVCAACENADGWIFFKKLLARFLLDTGRAEEAHPKLDELANLLPGDAEISALCRRN
jgi:glycosyltransferase involved in cell wall biosynthesis